MSLNDDRQAAEVAASVFTIGKDLCERINALVDEDVSAVLRDASYRQLACAQTYAALHDHIDVVAMVAYEEGRRAGFEEAQQ